MPLSQVSVRMEDELKRRADEKMKQIGTTPTQAITLLYQYIDQHGKLPFMVETDIRTADDKVQYAIKEIRHLVSYCKAVLDTPFESRKSNWGMKDITYITGLIVNVKKILHNTQTHFVEADATKLDSQFEKLFDHATKLATIDADSQMKQCLHTITGITDCYPDS